MNSLLLRQLRKLAPNLADASEAAALLGAVSTAYDELMRENRHLSHVLSLTSDELTAANDHIRREADSQIAALHQRFQQTLELQQGMLLCLRQTPRGFEHTVCRGELARRLLLTPESVEGRTVEEVAAPANVAELNAAYTRAWAGEEFAFTYNNARTGLAIYATLRPRRERGEVCEIISFSVDITALKNAEARLHELNTNLEQLVAARSGELARSERLLAEVIESTSDAILIVDPAGRHVRANKRFFEMWRLPPDLASAPDFEVRLTHLAQQVVDPAGFSARAREIVRSEERSFDELQFQDGRVFERFSYVLRVGDTVRGRVFSFRDITARKTAERARETLLALTQATLESTADGLLVVDRAGRIQTFNRKFAEMWRLSDDALAARDDSRALRLVVDQLAEPEKFLEKVRQLYAQPLAESFDTLHFKDGRVFERFSRPQLLHGEAVGRVWSFRDVSASKHAGQALAQAHRHASVLAQLGRELAEAATPRAAALAILEAARQLLGWDCSWIGFWNEEKQALENSVNFDLIDGTRREVTDAPRPPRPLSAAVRTAIHQGAYLHLRENEHDDIGDSYLFGAPRRSLSRMFVPIRRPGRLLGVFSIQSYQRHAYDQAGLALLQTLADHGAGALVRIQAERERTKLEETLRQSQKIESLGTLAGGIAHDFNNLLTGIFGYVEMSRQELPPDHPAQEWLHQTFITSQRAKELVRQILTFSRRADGERRPVQLAPIVAEALRLLRSTLPANVELASHFAPGCPPMIADATQIHQVVLNLCTNAWHSLPPRGGRIVVSLEASVPPPELARTHPTLGPGPAVRLAVADNGTGMDATTRARIFEPFFTTKPTGKGTGLGLAVVHGIVGAHGGAIHVRSAPGAGSTFELYFPALAAETTVAAVAADAGLPQGRGEELLWVDDDRASSAAIALTLQSLGYRVTACLGAEEALEKFRAAPESFALVVTDLAMPGCDGGELAAQMLRVRPGLPVLVLTGLIEPREQAALLQAGVREVLLKPPTREEIARAVARQLAKA